MEEPVCSEKPRDDEDRSLIRWMLSLTPSERLDFLQEHVNAVLAVRLESDTAWTSEHS